MEYERAATIPGTMSNKAHKITSIITKRQAPSAVAKCVKPFTISCTVAGWFREMDRQMPANPRVNGPETSMEMMGPTTGIFCRIMLDKSKTRVAPTAMPHLSFRDSLAMFINAAFSVFMFLVFQFQDFGLLSVFWVGSTHCG
jgi:hypothetical protein